MTRLIVFALALLCFASDAHAWEPSPELKLTRALPIAQAAWPGSPCAGRERVELVDHIASQPPEEERYGQAWVEECRVEIRRDLSDRRLCEVLVHELGHLARQDHWHSPDPSDVMHERAGPWGACEPPLVVRLREARSFALDWTDARRASCASVFRAGYPVEARCWTRRGRCLRRLAVRWIPVHRVHGLVVRRAQGDRVCT